VADTFPFDIFVRGLLLALRVRNWHVYEDLEGVAREVKAF
jgi:hypothetical protein